MLSKLTIFDQISPGARRLGAWTLLLGWMGLIFWISHQSGLPEFPDEGIIDFDLLIKKLAHVLVYLVLAELWWLALSLSHNPTLRFQPGNPALVKAVQNRLVLSLSFIFTLIYAASDEWHQTFIPNRHGQPSDVLIDMVGASIGLYLVWRIGRKRG